MEKTDWSCFFFFFFFLLGGGGFFFLDKSGFKVIPRTKKKKKKKKGYLVQWQMKAGIWKSVIFYSPWKIDPRNNWRVNISIIIFIRNIFNRNNINIVKILQLNLFDIFQNKLNIYTKQPKRIYKHFSKKLSSFSFIGIMVRVFANGPGDSRMSLTID